MKHSLYWWSQLSVTEQNLIIRLFEYDQMNVTVENISEIQIENLYQLTYSLHKILRLTIPQPFL